MDYSKEQIENYFLNLPPDIQDTMSSADIGDELMKIAQKHRLHVDTIDMLYAEVGKIMLGINHPRDFVRNLQKTIGLSPDAARAIAEEINDTIFKPIRESLKKVHQMGDAAVEEEKGVAFGTAGIAVAVTTKDTQQKPHMSQTKEKPTLQPSRSEFRFGITPPAPPAVPKPLPPVSVPKVPAVVPTESTKQPPALSQAIPLPQKDIPPPPNLPTGTPVAPQQQPTVMPVAFAPKPSQSVLRDTPATPVQFAQKRPFVAEQNKEVPAEQQSTTRSGIFPKGFGASPSALPPKSNPPTVVSEETLKRADAIDAIEFLKPTPSPATPKLSQPQPSSQKPPLSEPSGGQQQSIQSSGIIGGKLSSPVTAPMEQVEYKAEESNPPQPRQAGADPYREPTE